MIASIQQSIVGRSLIKIMQRFELMTSGFKMDRGLPLSHHTLSTKAVFVFKIGEEDVTVCAVAILVQWLKRIVETSLKIVHSSVFPNHCS